MRKFICIVFLNISVITAFAQSRPILAFASDTQQPMTLEKIFLKPNQNEKATEMIFKEVAAIHPAGFFILGDVVSVGYRNKKWAAVDKYMAQLKKNSIPVYATLGNHELMFSAAKGTKQFRSRFPMYKPEGYVVVTDSVAVVLLNSNFSRVSAAEMKAQDTWYINTIKKLDNDAAIRFIIVACHHSPYTNSTIVKPSILVQQKFVPAFINAKKAVLFLSGHSHNFERFKMQGKTFLVIGGGGGLHQPLNKKPGFPDLAIDYKPAFHYLQVMRDKDGLQIISRQITKDLTKFENGVQLKVQ